MQSAASRGSFDCCSEMRYAQYTCRLRHLTTILMSRRVSAPGTWKSLPSDLKPYDNNQDQLVRGLETYSYRVTVTELHSSTNCSQRRHGCSLFSSAYSFWGASDNGVQGASITFTDWLTDIEWCQRPWTSTVIVIDLMCTSVDLKETSVFAQTEVCCVRAPPLEALSADEG